MPRSLIQQGRLRVRLRNDSAESDVDSDYGEQGKGTGSSCGKRGAHECSLVTYEQASVRCCILFVCVLHLVTVDGPGQGQPKTQEQSRHRHDRGQLDLNMFRRHRLNAEDADV